MNKARDFYEKHKLPVLLALLVISIILPFVVKQALILRYICTIMMYATLAGSLNVINGYSGQTCLGQAGFLPLALIPARPFPRIWELISGSCFPLQEYSQPLWD